MKIALCSTFVPFVQGGARNIVDWLENVLEEHGHHIEKIYLPQIDTPDILFQQQMAFRWIDLENADRIICFRPQSHLIPHPCKILWFIHHIRAFYDLWDSPYRGFPDDAKHRGIRQALIDVDNQALREAKSIFTNSQVVSDRLKSYNQIDSEVLYPPIFQPERFYCEEANTEIVYICRIEHHKRQHLLIEALHHTKTPVRLRICGISGNDQYIKSLNQQLIDFDLRDRVTLENDWISEEKKAAYLSRCLAAAYLPVDEDSYGYPSIEAAHSSKPVLTTHDSGGVLEFVVDGINGYVCEPNPQALAAAMDKLYTDARLSKTMGQQAYAKIEALNICWSHVVTRLLA